MPGFELEQVDGGGEPINLPHGDTVIGRGPFLSVSDKRVSRNHAILENMDGQLRLKPTHVNPCFVQTSLDASPQPLEKDQWHCLKDGSIFSLLPGKHIFRVRAVAEEGTPRNSQGFEKEEEEVMETASEMEQNSKSSRSCEETLAYTPQAKNSLSFTYESKMRDEAHTADPAACNQAGVDSRSSCKSDTPDPLTPCKKRVLPAWMMDVTPATLKTPPAKAAKRAPARAPARNTPSSKPSGPKRPRARLPSLSGEEEEEKGVEEDEEEGCSTAPRKRARRLKSDTEESQDQAPVSESSQETPPEDEDAKEANVVQKTDEEDKEKESKRAEGSRRSKAGGSTLRPESSGSSQTNVQQKAKVQRRTPCPYGTSCYRKNPIHFQECSHPGDGDYEEEQNNEDDEDDDRPECPYGTDCYRKNPLHKKEYKHTKPPEKKTAPVDDDDDDDDEDQYENSFINDESEEEDVDEDSDYVPESEDSGKEDVKRLQKEAKAFLRRKK